MKTRLMFVALSASVLFATWGGTLQNIFSWSDGN
jgi:hypothetical protein